MSVVAAAVIGSAVVGGVAANRQAKAAGAAANTQAAAAGKGIDAQNLQFETIKKLLEPWVQGGTTALGGQMDLLGVNGAAPQSGAIDQIRRSPQFTALLEQGENSILANASATGGLRGGNTQRALSEFSPTLLAQLIEQQYGRLGGLSSQGQNAAVMTGNAGVNTGNQIAQLLQQQGAALAGGQVAQGRASVGYANAFNGAAGMFLGAGGFGGGGYTGGLPSGLIPSGAVF